MRHDGYDSDATVAAATRRQREICRSFTCISPWFIFWRWFNGGKSRVSRNRFANKNWGEEKMEGGLDVNRKSGIVSSSFRQDVSADVPPKEASFDVGVGFGFIYLVKHELNKMVELRKRVELLIQNFDTEIDNQETEQHYMPSRISISSSLSKTHVQEFAHGEEHRSSICASQIGFGSSRFRRERSLRMDQLEAELEAEFDRLQVQMDDGGFILNYSQELYPEENTEDKSPKFVEELSDLHATNETHEFYGVSPRDLKSKLHEVLEERQLERINELESALDYAIQQLEEKERELCWWKDSARLVAQRLPFVPGLLMELKQSMEAEYAVKEM